MEGSLVTSFQAQNPYSCEDRGVFICTTQFQHLNKIAQIALIEKQKAPVLLIMDEALGIAYMRLSETKRGDTTLLYGEECDEVKLNTILSQQFNLPGKDGKYGAYITNRQGGTGTDFPSHKTIEEKDGVRVIICVIPETWGENCQFKGRTGRMSNKGVVFYVIQDRQFVGQPQFYLGQQQTILKDKESKQLAYLTRQMNQYLDKLNQKKVKEVEKAPVEEAK